ncbi:MAG TPA: STAS domain-containing protein [Terracidiphilus sp.]|nr:STAS domain-containing protein [Terracidiphilus sp.]
MTTVLDASKILPGGNRMTFRPKPVSIRQLPENIDRKQERLFLHDLEHDLNVVRPAIVIDCSKRDDLNPAAIHLLLCSLEQAMKRNGDIRLSGVSPKGQLQLERADVDRLFRIFSTIGEAVESFHRRSHVITPPVFIRERIAQENAA